MTSDTNRLDPSAIRALDEQASVLMKRGIRLLDEHHPEAVREALACFDDARDIRRELPLETSPALRYGLAACWLNRADALMRLGEAAQVEPAVQAYAEALVLLRTLPLAEDARFPRRLAIACQNLGLALHAQGGAAVRSAITSLTEALVVLEHESAGAIADRQQLRATVCMNLANVWASQTTGESDALARGAARQAIALVAGREAQDVDAAEVGLRARHVLCQTLVTHLSRPAATMTDEVHDATDLVDDGLNLIRQWEQKGVGRFRGLAYDLFQFGARVYAIYQPQFLDEFLNENAGRTS